MSEEAAKLNGPDLTRGVELSTVPDGTMLRGHARGEPVLRARRGDELFAIGAVCTHYGAPLEQGLLVGDTVRCPWHHACFSLRTGEALRAPALDPVSRWRVEKVRDLARQFTPAETPVGAVYVREKLESASRPQRPASVSMPHSAVIVGGGVAGNAAVEIFDAVPFFRTEQYDFGIAYVGHAEHRDQAEIDGQLDARDCRITYLLGGKKLAVAVVHRDLDGLRAEVAFEKTIATIVEQKGFAGISERSR